MLLWVQILQVLHLMIYLFKMTEELNFKTICGIATTALGMPQGSLSLKTRKRPIQVARAATAYIAMKEDKIHRNIIADVLKRDRYRSYYTSTRGLLQGMYDKRIKSHFDSISITNLQKAFLGAYNDVIDVSKEIEDVGNKLIKRK